MPYLDHFGAIAPFYERLIHPREPEKMIARLGLPVQGAVLDAGGGTGRVSQGFIGLAGSIIVADISRGMLLQAQQKPGLTAVNTHSEAFPFPDGTFERIIMVDALHHVCNQPQTAAELWRVLRPGGKILIEEPDVRTFPVKLIALAEKLALMRSHFLSPARIAALFYACGGQVQVELENNNAYILIEK